MVSAVSDALEDVLSGRLRSRRMGAASQRGGCRLQRARPLGEPVTPGRPPRTLLLLGGRQPGFGVARQVGVAKECRASSAGRVDDTLDMAARAEDEFAPSAKDLR